MYKIVEGGGEYIFCSKFSWDYERFTVLQPRRKEYGLCGKCASAEVCWAQSHNYDGQLTVLKPR